MIQAIKKSVKIIFEYILASVFFCYLLIVSFYTRRKKYSTPSLVWGPNAINSSRNNAQLLKLSGRTSDSYVDHIYNVNKRKEFDHYYFDKGIKNLLPSVTRYLSFIKILKRYNIFITNYNGGFLRETPLRFCEHIFWKTSRKVVIVWPYGSDSTIYSKMLDHSFRFGYYKSYPVAAKREKILTKQIQYFTKYADFAIGNIPHHETCPRWDLVTVACYGIDTEYWTPSLTYNSINDGKNGEVKIIHSPNHKDVKGTSFLIKACDELKKEGFKIKLVLIEGMKQDELKIHMQNSDIFAVQFLYGYALTEIEGMSLCKPVLSNLSNPIYYDLANRYTYLKECPIVNTTPENLKNNLLQLITNPELRKKIGENGRSYVIKYHSQEAQIKLWTKIINKVLYEKDCNIDQWWE